MIYILILIGLIVMAIIENSYKDTEVMKVSFNLNNINIIKKSIYYITAIFLILFAGLRYETGFDYVNYVRMFKRAAYGERYLNVERAYYYINVFLHKITNNFIWIFLIMALVTLSIKFIFMNKINKKMKNTIFLSMLVYFGMYFLVYDMGQIRSSFAQAMGLISMFLYLNGKKKWAVIPILIGTTIHTSCAILFLIYILGDKRISMSKMLIMYILFLVIGQLLNLHLLQGIINLTDQKVLIDRFKEYTMNPELAKKIGMSLNLIFQTCILFIALLVRWYYKIKDKKFDFMLNIYFIGTSLYLLFNNYFVIGVRLSAYFNLAILFILPKLFSLVKNRFLRIILVCIIGLIMGGMVIRLLQTHSDIFLPYKFSLFSKIYSI